jgi:DNA-binding GntR family transcriptional regulator
VPGPKYREIAAVLEAEIRAMPGGSRVPGEHEIAERFGVSRATARAAVQDLTARNLVRRVRGSGSFSVRRVDYPINADRAPSWSATITAAGATSRSVVVSCARADPPPEVASLLGVAADRSCHRLVRRSYVDGTAAAWGIEWVPVDVVPDLAAALRAYDSLYRILLTTAGATPRRVWVRASAELLEPHVAAQLDATPSGPAWFVESLNTEPRDDRPLCLTQRWIRADVIRVVFESALAPERGAPQSSYNRRP